MVDTRTGRDIDRGYAWVILAACAVARYITVTLWIAYSILILEIKATFNTSHSLAGWGGSFQTGTSCLSGKIILDINSHIVIWRKVSHSYFFHVRNNIDNVSHTRTVYVPFSLLLCSNDAYTISDKTSHIVIWREPVFLLCTTKTFKKLLSQSLSTKL